MALVARLVRKRGYAALTGDKGEWRLGPGEQIGGGEELGRAWGEVQRANMVVEVGDPRSGRCTRDIILDQPTLVDDCGRKGRRRGQRASQMSNPDRGSYGDFLRPLGWL
ncbi:hypothetical protein TB2_003322 [Malus domestica]